MKALVTGGAGFVGSHVCRRLLEQGCTVVCVDNFASGSQANVAPLMEHPQFSLLERDVSAGPLEDALAADRYYHLAGLARW